MKETPATRLRRNKDYYLNELKNNAIRGKEKEYHKFEKRKKQISEISKERQKITGVFRLQRKFSFEEIYFLKYNYKRMTILELALSLERSWSSIEHKLNRLGLTKYNKWTK